MRSIPRNIGLLSVLLIGFCFFATAARAQDCCTPFEPDYYSWDTDSGQFNPPTTTTCVAWSSQNQRCRTCAEATAADGTPLGYKNCVYVDSTSACSCDNAGTANCKSVGACRYY